MKPSQEQIEALKEIINIGVGRGAGVLNTMLNSHIRLQVPFIKLLSYEELKLFLAPVSDERIASINLPFRGNIAGNARIVFPAESALKLIVALTGENPDMNDLDAIRAATLTEIGNIVLNSLMGSISNLFHLTLNYSVPMFLEGGVTILFDESKFNPGSVILLARTRFTIEELNVDGDIIVFFEVGSFDRLLQSIDALEKG